MGTSRNKPKRCETCVFYKPSDLKGQGWCTHPKRQQTGGMLLLVRAGALDCRNSWGEDFWTPADATSSETAQAPAPSPGASSAFKATSAPSTSPVEDLVVRQDSLMNDDLASAAHTGQRDDESINHAALSDQDERARVMARGAREAILRARERKKEQSAHLRQPRIAPPPSAGTASGDWTQDAGGHDDDLVLDTRHPFVDPFKRSYGDPAPPVPSREMPADSRGIVSRDEDERFDTVPEYRAEIELPRPSHYNAARGDTSFEEEDDGEASRLPENPEISSYDRVWQRARLVRRQSAMRAPHHAVHQESAAAAADSATAAEDDRAAPTQQAGATIASEPRQEFEPTLSPGRLTARDDNGRSSDTPDAMDADDASMAEWGDEVDPFPEDVNAPWVAAASLALATKPPARPHFRLPRRPFRRHGAQEARESEPSPAAFADEVVEDSSWTTGELGEPASRIEADDDPDWVEENTTLEAYVAAQPEASPADVSPDAYGETTWDDDWTVEAGIDGDWDDRSDATTDDDRVTSETTVPHCPQPMPPSFDLANLRARLFTRTSPASSGRTARFNARPDGMIGTEYRPRQENRQPAPIGTTDAQAPDDDPDPDPGSGCEAALPGIEEHWSKSEPEFDLRAVIRRQDELLDMRIQVAPDVPRACRTCRSFRWAEGGERGWCTNEWAFAHRRMVNADDLPCESSIGCWWLPADDVWLPEDDLAALAQPTPLVDRLLGRLTLPTLHEPDEEPLRARAR